MAESWDTFIGNAVNSSDFPVGGAVAAVKDGRIVYEKGFGKARLGAEERDFTPNTLTSIQSVSKSFTAASLLKLAEDRLLDLKAPLVTYLPYFRTADKQASDRITVEQLLSHTAGFPGEIGIGNLMCTNVREFSVFESVKEECGLTDSILSGITSREDVTKYFSTVNLPHPPGSNWDYCTEAYIIAADLFEKVGGRSWDEYMEQVMFGRLGLNRTTLDPDKVLTDMDSARYYTGDVSILMNPVKPDPGRKAYETPFPQNRLGAPMGFIYSTARDLARYLSSYMTDEPFIPKELMARMHEPVWNLDNEEGYALGWGTLRKGNLMMIEHGGGFPGVRSYVCMVPAKGIGAVVVSNHDETPAREICDAVMERLLER